mgnify:CR=1 FL=1
MLELIKETIFSPEFSGLILRLTVGIITMQMGYKTLGKGFVSKVKMFESIGFPLAFSCTTFLGSVQIILGLLLVSGTFIQEVSLCLVIIFITASLIKAKAPILLDRNVEFFVLLSIICLSLALGEVAIFAGDLYLK